MICQLCHGFGSLLCVQSSKLEWWSCQACGGAGTRVVFGPPTIAIHKFKIKKGKQR